MRRRCHPAGSRRRSRGGDGAGSDASHLAEQAAPVQTLDAEPLGNGEHHLPVRHRRDERRVEPLRPDRQPLGVTAGAAVAALAREREQRLVHSRVAADAREPAVEHAAGEELVRGLRDLGPPRAVRARAPSPFCCATGRSDATFARRGLNDACCCRADRRSAQREASGGPLATKPALGRHRRLSHGNDRMLPSARTR